MEHATFYICTVLLSSAVVYGQAGRFLPRILRQHDDNITEHPAPEEEQEHTPPPPQLQQVDCGCSKIYDPVCASNDKSYYNPCHMECDVGQNASVTFVHQGNCIPF